MLSRERMLMLIRVARKVAARRRAARALSIFLARCEVGTMYAQSKHRIADEGPLWDQLTMFGPPPPTFEVAPPVQFDLPGCQSPNNAAAMLAADTIARARATSLKEAQRALRVRKLARQMAKARLDQLYSSQGKQPQPPKPLKPDET